jgi:hypothetical protein
MLTTHVKDRAETQSTDMNDKQRQAVKRLANDLHRLNTSMIEAVNAGISIELQRGARHHAEGGYWGDLMIPVVMRKSN